MAINSEHFRKFQQYFLYFVFYSVIGWAYEVFLEVVVYQWGFTNRGVLFGPYCPIYGFGGLAFLLCFNKIIKAPLPKWARIIRPVIIFIGCMLVATAIELAASYLLEFLTGSWPWQTYKDYSINFEGRIALSPSIRFGLGGVIFLYLFQPLFEKLVHKFSDKKLKAVFLILAFLMGTDFIILVLRTLLAL